MNTYLKKVQTSPVAYVHQYIYSLYRREHLKHQTCLCVCVCLKNVISTYGNFVFLYTLKKKPCEQCQYIQNIYVYIIYIGSL